MTETLFFLLFLILVLGILLTDLLVVGRNSHIVKLKEAAIWSSIWISLGLGFAVFLRYYGETVHGIQSIEDLSEVVAKYAATVKIDNFDFAGSLDAYRKYLSVTYLSGYLIEESLSVDNLFVIMAILAGFSVKQSDYKKVLFWGILGAILMRFIFIFAGAALIHRFEWVMYIFGAYLFYTGIRMYLKRKQHGGIEPQKHPVVIFLSKRFRVFPRYVSDRFFIKKDGNIFITPLFIVVIIIEFSDLIFALDSVPAIFAVTRDPYIVFFSNVFAILGLRSLFFLLVHVIDRFYLLKTGVAVLLVFVGLKIFLHEWLMHIGFKTVYSLYFILFVLLASIVLSVLFPVNSKLKNEIGMAS